MLCWEGGGHGTRSAPGPGVRGQQDPRPAPSHRSSAPVKADSDRQKRALVERLCDKVCI